MGKPGFFAILREPPVMFPTVGDTAYPLFTRVSLETTSTCTRRCAFCCVDKRPAALRTMSDALYAKVIAELGALRFAGVVQWFYVNEPLLDKQIVPRLRALRVACPRATIHITSNGDVFKRTPVDHAVDRIVAILDAGCTVFNLNAYDSPAQHAAHLALLDAVARAYPKARYVKGFDRTSTAHGAGGAMWKRYGGRAKIIHAQDMTNPTALHDWANARVAADAADRLRPPVTGHCARPARHLVIAWDGTVPLCCAIDPTHPDGIVGDVTTRSLVDVWNGALLFRARWFLQQGRRVGVCTGCREKTAFPHVVRKVMANSVTCTAWEASI